MDDVLGLGWAIWLFCLISVFGGTLLQRIAGQGFGMVAAPLLALVVPQFLPAVLLLLGLVIGLSATALDLSAVTRTELPFGFAGRALGAVLATLIALSLPDPQAIAPVVAILVFLGIGLSILGVRVPIRPVTLFTAGTVAGIMGTLTAVGAPPKALLYQYEDQSRSAAMQNVFFAWGMVVSIAALALAGLIAAHHLYLAFSLLPAVAAGIWLAQPVARRVAKRQIRPYALALSGAAVTVLLLRWVLTG